MDGQDLSFDFINLYTELLGAVLDLEKHGRHNLSSPVSSFIECGSVNSVGLELREVGLMNKKRRVTISSPNQSATSYREKTETKKKSTQKRSDKVGAAFQKEKENITSHIKPFRRAQATESHRLAERGIGRRSRQEAELPKQHSAARREKINERFRRLQNLVPGCDKSMGMAVMLDEIITYIQSLQNQVEFLCMKLESCSFFQRLNMQGDERNTATNVHEVLKQMFVLNNNCEGTTISAQSPFLPTDSQRSTFC